LLGDSTTLLRAVVSAEEGGELNGFSAGDRMEKSVLGVPNIGCLKIKREGVEDEDTEPEHTDSDETDIISSFVEDEDEEPMHPVLAPHDDFRRRYMDRLARSRAWLPAPQRPPAHQAVIIFDWDDTLLCTTWLSAQGPTSSAAVVAQLAAIEKLAFKMLSEALSIGRTFIITNAAAGWVRRSATTWAPSLLPLLEEVEVISARDCFASSFPDEVDRWKVEAFLEVQRKLPATLVTNLIALGDSEFEMHAARSMREQFEHPLLKTVKFLPTPSPGVLLKQMEVVAQNLGKIVSTTKNMRIVLNKRP